LNTILLISPKVEIIQWPDDMEHVIELAARNCYQSAPGGNTEGFLKSIIKRGHESVLEHCCATVKITCDRSCSHQLVRHRLGAYSQESQRYVNYGKKPMSFICPPQRSPGTYTSYGAFRRRLTGRWSHDPFLDSLFNAKQRYIDLLDCGWKAEDAREVLPNCTTTRVVTTYNMRQWRHIFKERALNKHAQHQIKGIMLDVLERFKEYTYIFDDLGEGE